VPSSETEAAAVFERRAATVEEMELARGLAQVEPFASWAARVVVYLLIASGLCYLAYALMDQPEGPPTLQDQRFHGMLLTLGIGCAVVLSVCVVWRAREYVQKGRLLHDIEADLSREPLNVARIRPLDVVQLDYHRRLPTLVFRIDEAQAVAVYLVNVVAPDAALPNTEFEYVRFGATGHTLRIIPLGRKIAEVKHVDGAGTGFDDRGYGECEPFDVDWKLLTRGATVAPVAENITKGK
jgi:hypothetical protein